MKLYILMLICLLPLAGPAFGAVDQRRLVSEAVGRVAGRVVTSREVAINRLVDAAIYKKGRLSSKLLKSIKKRPKKSFVTGVLMEWVVFLEAERFHSSQLNEREVDFSLKKVGAKLSKLVAWKSLRVEKRELRSLIQRKLRAKEFIRFRIESSYIPVTDNEVRKYFEINRIQFGTLPFKSFKRNIRAFLKKQQIESRLKGWFDVLQRKHKVNWLSGEG